MVNLKKSSTYRRSHETSGLKRFLIVLLIFMGCAGVLGLFWFLSQLGPKAVDYGALNVNVEVSSEAKALREHSIEFEAQFEEVLAIRSAEPQDVLLLKRALDLQRQYVDAAPGHNTEASQRLDNLEKRYQDLSAEHLKVISLELESEALKLANAQSYEAARDKYQEAFEQQKTINEDFPLSSAYNVGRATRLQRQARYLTAEPLLQQSMDLERQADAFIEKNEWESAAGLLKQAMQIQQQLNREYRGTNQASVSRLERLKVKWVGIESGQYYLEIEQVSDMADASRAEGETLEAASLYQEVARLQKQLNQEYPDSPYASSERVAEFQRKSQTAQSFELGLEIEKNHDLLKRLLSERRTYEAAEVIVALRRGIKQMQDAFSRSSLNDEELQVKVRYLNLVQNDLGYIQDRVYDALLPVPDAPGLRMLRTEVPQALYALMMGTNPSRNQGDLNPVDSVSWTEAKSFCERLSWILGKEVRLPTENEFRQALGRLRYVVLEGHVWSVSDSDGVAQPVGKKEPFASGFYDLLGNVSEWLESIDRFETEDARHVGGHAQDRIESIFTVPMRSAPRGERNRLTGFRVVVAID
jgi:formylglycine-generating enzyme required for sulfatase activity